MRVGTRMGNTGYSFGKQDHPHACGDKHLYSIVTLYLLRIIPMRVGTSMLAYTTKLQVWDHPHACGDKFQCLNKRC